MDWEDVKDKLSDVISNKRFFLMIFLALIFILIAIHVYNNTIKPKIDADYVANKEYLKKSANNNNLGVDLMYFYTTWCPHCKNARAEWDKFKARVGNNKINGYSINFLEVDCDKDEQEANKYDVEGYPTIKLIKGGSVIEYDAKPDAKTLMQFVEQFTK